MLRWLAGALTVVTILLLAPGTLAHAPALDTTPQAQTATFDEIACIPTCHVDTERTYTTPPVVIVQNGTTVTWESTDGDDHTVTSNPPEDTVDMIRDGRTIFQPGPCLDLAVNPARGPAEAVFKIEDGVLQAQNPSEEFDEEKMDEPPWRVCDEASPTIDGGWLLAYHCAIHPQLQHGFLHVLPP